MRAIAILVTAAVAGLGLFTATGAGAEAPSPAVSLPAPYNGWNVTVTPQPTPGTFTVAFNSPALGERVDNTVFLPAGYAASGAPWPVVYYLHGTVIAEAASPLLAPLTSQEYFADMISQGGGAKQTALFDFASQQRSASFVVVAPDTDPAQSICNTCFWMNGQGPTIPFLTQPEQAERFMLSELQPLVEALLNVRADRGGRGIIGFSMGGWSALLYGERHPDLYSFVGSVSGVPETSFAAAPGAAAALEAVGYLRSQGYGVFPLRNPVYDEEFDPAQMASNLAGEGVTLLFSTGDGCVVLPADLTAADCVAHPAYRNPAGAAAELLVDTTNAAGQAAFAHAGVPFRSVHHPGIHGANDHTVYASDIVPLGNATFATAHAAPSVFDFRSADQRFDIWGYHVQVDSSGPAFTMLTDAHTDGTAFSLTAAGTASVTTPPSFQPGQPYAVVTRCGSTPPTTTPVVASSTGTITTVVPSGGGQVTCSVAITP